MGSSVDHGTEMIVGGKRDPQFGPVVVGMGIVLVEFFPDIHLVLAPIDQEMAENMVKSLKGYKLLEGYWGSPQADIHPLVTIIKGVSDLMVHFPSISEIDLNPVKVLERGKGAVVVDCKIFLNG